MKKKSRTIWVVLATLLLIMSQLTVFARSNYYSPSESGLSTVQIIGGVALVILAIVLPSVRGSRRAISK